MVNGRSRAFVNDTPVNLETLKNIGSKIIDFPDPVSPVITEKPFLKSIDKKSIKIKFFISKWTIMLI